MMAKSARILIVVLSNIVLFALLRFIVVAGTLVVSNTDDSGAGSLRQAIVDANPGDVITFDSGLAGETIVLGSELSLDKSITISSTIPITISGNDSVRVFNVSAGSAITLTGLTIADGNTSGDGGGLYNSNGSTITIMDTTFSNNHADSGGAIFNDGGGSTVTLINSTVISNTTINDGGGIFNTANPGGVGTVTLTNSSVISNTADDGGVENPPLPTIFASDGGGIFNAGLGNVVTLNNSVVRGNRATGSVFNGGGGGIYNGTNGTVVLNDSIVQLNTAENGHGGGINNQGSGKLNVTSTTISGNTAAQNGGGILDKDGGSVATLINSTISGNTASANGGGIHNMTSGTVVITHTTITDNGAATNGGGIRNQTSGIVTLRNSIVANSIGSRDCSNTATITSNGYNLSSDNSCTTFTNTGDMMETDPLLSALQDNSGPAAGVNGGQPMLTHGLLFDSPALNAATCVPEVDTDQRGFQRPSLEAFCDIGAFEAALALEKSATPAIVPAGQDLTYTLDFAYVGLGSAENVVITDTIPVSLTNVTVTSSGAAITDTGAIPAYVWQVADLLPGEGGTITITGQVDPDSSPGPLANSATIFATLEDGNPGDAGASVTTTVTETSEVISDLTIAMVDDPDPVAAGEQLTYTLTVTNQGPDEATGVVVTDTLPSGVSAAATSGCAEDPAGVPLCSLGTIAAGNSAVYTITVMVDAGATGVLTNTAQVEASNTLINTGDDSTSETTSVTGVGAEADLALSKLASSATTALTDTVTVNFGNVVTFTVVTSNNGPGTAAAGTAVSDTLPAGLTFDSFVSATAGTFSNSGNQVSWTDLPAMSPSEAHTLIYRATVDADTGGQTLQNTAEISATLQADPDSSNSASSVTVMVNEMIIYIPYVTKNFP